MRSHQNVTIALLCVSAAVMAGLLVLTSSTDSSFAGESAVGGHYIMFTGQVPGNTEMLYVIDRNAQKMNLYTFSNVAAGNTLSVSEQIDLDKAFR